VGKILSKKELLDLLEDNLSRYGIAMEKLSDYQFDLHRRKYISIYRAPAEFDFTRSISKGIPFLRFRMAHPKLTTAGAMLIGHLATRNIVDLNADEAKEFLKCELITIDSASTVDCDPKGFVIARCDNVILGVAFYEEDEEGKWLKGLFPARWRKGNIMPFQLDL